MVYDICARLRERTGRHLQQHTTSNGLRGRSQRLRMRIQTRCPTLGLQEKEPMMSWALQVFHCGLILQAPALSHARLPASLD
jgi:hypothetical protein